PTPIGMRPSSPPPPCPPSKPPFALVGPPPAAIPLALLSFTPPPKQPPSHGSTLFPALQTHAPTLPLVGPANSSHQNRPSLPCPSSLIPHSPPQGRRSHSRDFVPWRFSYACRRRAWIRSSRRRPKTLYGVIFVKGVPGGPIHLFRLQFLCSTWQAVSSSRPTIA